MKLRHTAITVIALTLLVTGGAHGQARYSFETPDDYLAPAASWTALQEVLTQHEADRETIQQCLEDEASCTRKLRRLRLVLTKGAELSLDQQIRLVNRYINKHRYVDDRIQRSSLAGNKFETLTEFLQSGGDCEDFALAKYFVLREFGVPAHDMRIVVGKERRGSEHHAMLAVNTGDDVVLLENDNRIYRNGNRDLVRFVYAVNELGIWDHETEN